jgi:hypothetical protein
VVSISIDQISLMEPGQNSYDIIGLWEQRMGCLNTLPDVFGGYYQVVKNSDGSYQMLYLKDKANYARNFQRLEKGRIKETEGIKNVSFDGTTWKFDSDWGERGIGNFILVKTEDNIFEGFSYLNGQPQAVNKWMKVE